jgi:hypothetical protein
MDDPTCHDIFGIQSVEENNKLCMEALHTLLGMKNKLDRPLGNFTPEDIREIAEQIRTITQELFSLPTEMLDNYIRSRDIIFQNLETIVIELNIALDQLTIGCEKAVFYRHLFASQKCYTIIFTQVLSKDEDSILMDASLAPIIDLSARASFNYKLLLDFSCFTLPDIFSQFQGFTTIKPTQCEMAIIDMERLEGLLERQKVVMLNKKSITPYVNDCDELHYWLTVALAYASELIQKIINSFSGFQSCCRSKSKQAMQSREEIVYYLTLFTRHYTKILKKMDEMNRLQDETHISYRYSDSQAKKIISIRR